MGTLAHLLFFVTGIRSLLYVGGGLGLLAAVVVGGVAVLDVVEETDE